MTRRLGRAGPVSALCIAAAVLAGMLAPAASQAASDPATGLVSRSSGPCAHRFEVRVHGQSHSCAYPDAMPKGVTATRDGLTAFAAATASGAAATTTTTAASTPGLPCYGDGQAGNRVQALYVSGFSQPDRIAQMMTSIPVWAAAVDSVFAASAGETGGVRHVRWVTDSSCNLVIYDVRIPDSDLANLGTTISDVQSAGFNRPDRKYLMWTDSTVYCGIAEVMGDDSPGQGNASNGGTPEYARVDSDCWGVAGQSIEAHELMHTLGAVQTSAPHATQGNHCTDTQDRMCYSDSPYYPAMQYLCLASTHDRLFDCNHDDYFSTNPPPGSYLATHWNTANSSFLASTPSDGPLPTPLPAGAGYVLDAWGGLHPVGLNLLPASATLTWYGANAARGVALLPSRTGGYVLEQTGALHPFAVGGNAMPPTPIVTATWAADAARGIAVLPDGSGGYVLDAAGALHPFSTGGPMPAAASITWYGNAAQSVVMTSPTGGYVLDVHGGVHPWAVGSNPMPPAASVSATWPNWPVARGLAMVPGGSGGYVLDAAGGLHPFSTGGATPPNPGLTWYGNAASAVVMTSSTGGYVVDNSGGVHPFGAGGLAPLSLVTSLLWTGLDLTRGVVL